MQTQPSPDAPTPPPSEAAIRSRRKRKRKWLWSLGLLCVLAFAAMASVFRIFSTRNCNPPAFEAEKNARQLEMALDDFKYEYGNYPCESTASAVRDATESTLPLGNKTSNDFLRQLLAAGGAQSEQMFYAKIAGSHKPDGVITPGEALKKGECGFSYIVPPAKYKGIRPLLVTPLVPGKDVFDPKPLDGKAIVIWSDATQVVLPVDKSGHVIVDGRNLMDPHHPVWEGQPPVIAYPDL